MEGEIFCEYCQENGHNDLLHENDGPLCECGHFEMDHHVSWFRNGYKLVEECEYYGSNETGGLEWKDATWSDHCQKFRRAK